MTNLEKLVEMYGYSRGRGHTTAMLEGAKSRNAVIIVADSRQGQQIKREHKGIKDVVSIHDLDRLRGYHGPILVDHYALQMAFWEHQEEMEKKMLAGSKTKKK